MSPLQPAFVAGILAGRLNLPRSAVGAAVTLLDEGNTVPFIARYRKENTGGLDEEALYRILEDKAVVEALEARRASIQASLAEQGVVDAALLGAIEAATTRTDLEDLYQPYRPKRRTRASVARDRGLGPLAEAILAQPRGGPDRLSRAAPFVKGEVEGAEEALAGARDIVAELVSDLAQVRREVRAAATKGLHRATRVSGSADPKGIFASYYTHEGRVDRLRPHQVLATDRGESVGVLRVAIVVPERDWRAALGRAVRPHPASPLAGDLEAAAVDGVQRLLLPAVERDVRRSLTESAQAHAMDVFADNLRAVLLQPPVPGRIVLGIDPAFRTGCKLAVVDGTGRVLETGVVFPHAPQDRWEPALQVLQDLVRRHAVDLIAIGNGTASRETERLAAELVKRLGDLNGAAIRYALVSEAGASVYSASALARSELPDLDVTLRGAVSIARRLQDPLSELVKIDPRSIGVGQYQHDLEPKRLAARLDAVVETAVNRVGVDANTASPALLAHVAGIGPTLAGRLVTQRETSGPFRDRRSLEMVPGLGPAKFLQAAGFLRVHDGAEPLDATAIHPESYPVARTVLQLAGVGPDTELERRQAALAQLTAELGTKGVAERAGAGEPTVTDILEQLARPGRDPRSDMPGPLLRSDVLGLDDLVRGLRLPGTVRNVVDFGAFVDIGVKHDGLLHTSRWPKGIRLAPGDVIEVQVESVDAERGRIALAWADVAAG